MAPGDRARVEAPSETAEVNPETILLVEDNASLRLALRRLLKATGFEVLAAESASEAEELFGAKGENVDLLLTDVLMPGRSGPELARSLRSQRPELPVLFMSGYVDDKRRREIGDDVVVQKPVTRAALTAEIRSLLNGG